LVYKGYFSFYSQTLHIQCQNFYRPRAYKCIFYLDQHNSFLSIQFFIVTLILKVKGKRFILFNFWWFI